MEIYEVSENVSIIGCHGKTLEVNHSVAVLADSLFLYEAEGYLIQRAFPYLTDDEREFILTGMTASEWDELFGEDDE